MSGMGAEIAKNLVLSGVHLLTILDPTTVTVDDLRSNFLLPHDSIGKNVWPDIWTSVLMNWLICF